MKLQSVEVRFDKESGSEPKVGRDTLRLPKVRKQSQKVPESLTKVR